jgi:hypothetical protein
MSSEESYELRLAAMIVWHYWNAEAKAAREATEAEQSRRIQSFRKEIERIVGRNFDIRIIVNGGCLEAIIEDVHFIALEFTSSATQEHTMLVSLLGRCRTCGVETMSEPFYNLAGLGKMLEKFKPSTLHSCCIIKK